MTRPNPPGSSWLGYTADRIMYSGSTGVAMSRQAAVILAGFGRDTSRSAVTS